MSNIIVTGVTGQDGSYMVDYLLANTNHNIYGAVRRSANPNYSNLLQSINNPRFKIIHLDLADSVSINEAVKTLLPEYFINLAAQSFVGASWTMPEITFDINATGVLRCLEAIRQYAPMCRFYNAGTSEQFGDVQTFRQDENHPHRARSPYGAAKIAAHQIVKVYRESYNLYAVQGILFNHESERRGHEFVTRKISRYVGSRFNGSNVLPRPPLELGNLDALRDWSHAEDFVDGIWRMLNQDIYREEYLGKILEKYNKEGRLLLPKDVNPSYHQALVQNLHEYVLSSDTCYSIREFVENAIEVATEGSIQVEWRGEGLSETLNDTKTGECYVKVNPAFYRPAEVNTLLGNSLKARQELKWKPKNSFNDLVSRMVKNDLNFVKKTL